MGLLDFFKNKSRNWLINKVDIVQSKVSFIDTITPQAIKHAISDIKMGKLLSIQSMYDLLYKNDDNLAADTDVRTEAIKTATYSLPDKLSKQQKEYFTEFLDRHLPDLIDHVMDLKLRGLIFRQIIYTQGGDGLYYVKNFEDYQNADLRLINGEIVLYADDRPVSLNEAQFVRKFSNYAVYESLLKYYAFVGFALNNWASFMETYGKPIRVGKYRAGTSQSEQNKLWDMVKSLGTDLAAMISENTMIEFVEHKNTTASSDLYKSLLTFCRESVTKRILGQILTTTSQATGSYAQAKVHDNVRQDILQGDLRDAGLYISEVCTKLNQINFNTDDIAIKLHPKKEIDLEKRIEIDMKLVQVVPIDADYFYETYDIPKPKNKRQDFIAKVSDFQPVTCQPIPNIWHQVPDPRFLIPDLTSITKKCEEYLATLNSYQDIKNAEFPLDLYLEFGQRLAAAILESYSSFEISDGSKFPAIKNSVIDVDWSMEDTEALNAFRANAFEVAGVTCQETLAMLKEEAEKAFTEGITFSQWRDNIELKGFKADNPYHLRTNFETAVNAAYMAREWNELQKVKDSFPYLKYVTINDDRVRESHRVLHGLIYHQDDPFWDENYPPNGWNCRCSVRPMSEADAKADPNFGEKADPYTIPTHPNFKKNCAKEGEIIKLDDKKIDKATNSINSVKLPDPETYPSEPIKHIVKIPDTATKKDVIKTMGEGIGDRVVTDVFKFPVQLASEKANKFEYYGIEDLKKRTRYIKNIDDILQNPTEVWLDTAKKGEKRLIYVKKYIDNQTDTPSKNLVALTEFKDGEFEYFNIMLVSDMKKLRKGQNIPLLNIKMDYRDE